MDAIYRTIRGNELLIYTLGLRIQASSIISDIEKMEDEKNALQEEIEDLKFELFGGKLCQKTKRN